MKYLKGRRTEVFGSVIMYEHNGKCMIAIIKAGEGCSVLRQLYGVEPKHLSKRIDVLSSRTKAWMNRREVKPNIVVHMRKLAIARLKDESGEASI